MVMLSHPSPPAVEGAKHLSSTLSTTTESLLSCIIYCIYSLLEGRENRKDEIFIIFTSIKHENGLFYACILASLPRNLEA